MDSKYLTQEEKELAERGLLDESRVYSRLDEEALQKAVWTVKTPLEKLLSIDSVFFPLSWKAEIDDSVLLNEEAESCSVRTLKLLKRIENTLSLEAFVAKSYGFYERISVTVKTRDGRDLKLHFFYR